MTRIGAVAGFAFFLALAACDRMPGSAPRIEGRYTVRLEYDTTTLDFSPDGSVMFYPMSLRYEWKRSNDTVFVYGLPGAQTIVLAMRGDSLISNLGLVFLRDRTPATK